jgi:phage-related protein
MAIFNYCPSVSSSSEESAKILSSQFGDGYEQRISDGINSIKRSWQVSFSGKKEYINEIRDFLRARNGVESFEWTPPDGEEGKWTCDSWNKTYASGSVHTLRTTFKEVFE